MKENIFTDKKIDAILRDVRLALTNKQYEITPQGIYIGGGVNLTAGGIFDINVLRSEKVQQAIDEGDQEKELWLRNQLALGKLEKDYFMYDASSDHNLLPDKGINFTLGLLFNSSVTKKTTWYPSAFRNNVTPGAAWDANWAGASSGPLGNELNATYVNESARAAATFGTAASKSISMSSSVSYTIKTGQSNVSIYGGTLNSINTFDYNIAYDGANGHVLVAATLRASPVTGLAATDVVNISYTISGTSS